MAALTKLELLELAYCQFQGQAVSITGGLVAGEENGVDEYGDIDLFADSPAALQFALAHAIGKGWRLDDKSARKLTFAHRWGQRPYHVETYRLLGDEGELNLSYKTLGKIPVRGTAAVLLTFDFGFLLTGYDCLADSFQEARLDLRGGFFPKEHAAGGPYPMVPDKARAWERGEFGMNTAIRQAQRTAKYALRGYDMSAIVPQLITGYERQSLDQMELCTPKGDAISDIYAAIANTMRFEEWEELLEATSQLTFNAELHEIQAVFD